MFQIIQDGGDFYVMEGDDTVKTYHFPARVETLDDAELARMWFRTSTYHGSHTLYVFAG